MGKRLARLSKAVGAGFGVALLVLSAIVIFKATNVAVALGVGFFVAVMSWFCKEQG